MSGGVAKVELKAVVPCDIEQAFDFVAAFERVARWDPGTLSSEKVSDGPPRVGSTYQLVIKMGKRTTPVRYETVHYDRPLRLTFRGEGDRLSVEDDVRFASVDAGTQITYRADIRLKGPMRTLEIFARGAIRRAAADAMAGLERALSG